MNETGSGFLNIYLLILFYEITISVSSIVFAILCVIKKILETIPKS